MGIVPNNLRYDTLSHSYFKNRSIYARALVKITDANIGDTIAFQYCVPATTKPSFAR